MLDKNRETRRQERMSSKEQLPVRFQVSGLGLEPRWPLNRLQTTSVINIVVIIEADLTDFKISRYVV